jgi:phage gpG-like protein
MMAEIEFKYDDKAIRDFLEGLAKKKDAILKRETAYVNVISAEVYREVIRHFEQEEGSRGPWKNWAKSYSDAIDGKIAFRKFNGVTVPLGPEQIKAMGIKPPRPRGMKLQDSGALRQSFRAGNWRNKSDGIEWYNPAKTKSGFPYAAAHDIGGEKLPKRDFMWLSDKSMDKISELTLNFFTDV